MSELWAFLAADGAATIMATLHRLAEASHTPADHAAGDHRSADQRRADALIDLATSMALALAADANGQRLLTDPATGALTDVGQERYMPPAALAELGITRDRRCRFPGCRHPRIDLDDTTRPPPPVELADPPPF